MRLGFDLKRLITKVRPARCTPSARYPLLLIVLLKCYYGERKIQRSCGLRHWICGAGGKLFLVYTHDRIVLFELLTKQYFFEGESEISAVNKAVRLAGTVCENAEDRMEFDTLCGKCHLHFPDMQSQLRDFLDNQVGFGNDCE